MMVVEEVEKDEEMVGIEEVVEEVIVKEEEMKKVEVGDNVMEVVVEVAEEVMWRS